jgi:flagellar hook-associated protein 3 FlgL
MSTMRVTVGSFAYSGLQAIQSTSQNLADLQAKLSSGKAISQPSDDPTGTVQAMNLRSEMARNDQYATNANDAISWLSTADSAYSQIVSVLQQARTLVVQGLNTGVNDASANSAIASQVDALRSSLISLANTKYNGRPVFGGTTAAGAAYDSSGTYVGDTGTVTRMVGPDTTVTVSNQGPSIFGTGAGDVFSLLSSISSALTSSPSSLSGGSLSSLDSAISTVSAAQATEGATYQAVQRAQTAQTTASTALTTQLSTIEDVDPAKMAIEVTTANTAYQAALQTTASIRQLSLLDFLQ